MFIVRFFLFVILFDHSSLLADEISIDELITNSDLILVRAFSADKLGKVLEVEHLLSPEKKSLRRWKDFINAPRVKALNPRGHRKQIVFISEKGNKSFVKAFWVRNGQFYLGVGVGVELKVLRKKLAPSVSKDK
jgi:hypothetical protein